MSPQSNRPTIKYVCQWLVRHEFNVRGILEGVTRGDIVVEIADSRPPPSGRRLPAGTLSETVWFKDRTGAKLARAHRYLCTDGGLAGSGFPDPKSVFNPGEVWIGHDDASPCADCPTWEPLARSSLRALESYRRRTQLR
jgi:hypothetical protein